MSTTSNPLDGVKDTSLQSGEVIRDLLVKLPVSIILKFRERMNNLHIHHLEIIAEILKAKGYTESTDPQVTAKPGFIDCVEICQPTEPQEFNNG